MTWTRETIHEAVEKQRAFFRSGQTLDVSWRIGQLKKLRAAVRDNSDALLAALYQDLGKAEAEGYFCEIGTVLRELSEAIRCLRRWARPETRYSGLLCFPSVVTKVHSVPYGVSLIVSPFNFPVYLSLAPLTAALAAGNTAVIKASSKSPASTAALQKLLSDVFPAEYVLVVDGGHDAADLCLSERFDKIFYTGSPKIGRHVLEMAAPNLTPAALELGGETGNWCVIRKDADLRDAARKIAFFKLLNSGQICIDINQVAVAEEVAEEFLRELKAACEQQIGANALDHPEYPHMITPAAYEKCAAEAERYRDRIVFGGEGDPATLKYQPTAIYPVGIDEPIVSHELFSPLLPVVPYPDAEIESLLRTISEREHGLALYLFTKDLKWARATMARMQYGGGCINEVCMQLISRKAPFNGTGHSGMGAYHGVWGFREFSHPSTVLIGSTRMNLPLREHPYGGKDGWKLRLLRLLER